MDDCIEWSGARNSKGYGHCRDPITKRTRRVHRVAWEQTHGPIPDGMYVLHRCDNRACINVEHLFLGTQADNMADMRAKGRAKTAPGEQQGQHKLTEAQVREIRLAYAAGGITHAALALRYGVVVSTVSNILTRRTWKHV